MRHQRSLSAQAAGDHSGHESPNLDEDAARACFKKTAQASKGCKTEIIQRDVYQIGHSPDKVKHYAEIAREEMGM